MEITALIPEAIGASGALCRCRVLAVLEGEGLAVEKIGGEEDAQEAWVCDVLEDASGRTPSFAPGDTVLAWLGSGPDERGVVLGRIGRPVAPPRTEPDAPDELVLEAKKNLTLRCGDGSITIREDGRILIKGKDLVSHARRVNRIKGGSVAIN